MMPPATATGDPPISAKTFEGSFSALWVPTIARVGAFFHIFRDLQDLHFFAPLHTQIFVNFESISRVFEQILMKICRNFTGLKDASQNFGEISNFDELGVRGLPKKLKLFRRNPRFSDLWGDRS